MRLKIRFLKKFIFFFLLIVFMLLAIINIPLSFVSSKTTDTDYSNWMSENLTDETLIIDVKMLGAHDAFSYEIDNFSDVDEKSAESLMTGFTGRFIKGFSVRQSKTQMVSAAGLLYSGVRYLDMRLSYNDKEETYYTTHNYFSSPLNDVLKEIETFLENNPGEFIILDLQHVYGVDYDNQDDFDKLFEYFEVAGVLDYAYLDNVKELSQITYKDITSNKSKGGVILLSKFTCDNDYFWDYNESIRSNWANEDEYDKIITFLEAEKLNILLDSHYGKFNIIQGVATMEMSFKGILRSFETWSLLKRAREFNLYLLDYDGLEELLEVSPILMLDFVSDYKIIDQYMEIIIDINT